MSSAISLSPTASVPSSLRRGSYLAPDLVVRGRIQCSGVVEIDGAMQGDIQAETLVVGPQGRISAAIDANTALVGGKVDGVLKSRTVTFAQGCDFNGEVQYEALGVEPEASVQGVLVPVVGSNARHHAGQTILPVERPVSRMPKVTAKPAARAASAEGQAGASRERASPRGRTILWVVTLMGVLLGAGLAALVGGTPGVVQWWTLVRSEPPVTAPAKPPVAEESTVTAGAGAPVPPVAASGEPPVDAQPAKVAPAVDKSVVPEKQISAKAQADAEIAEKATAAARIKADAEAKAKADALAEKAAAAKAKAEMEAAAKAEAKAIAEAEAAAAAKAKAETEAAAEKARVTAEGDETTGHKGAAATDGESEKPRESAKRSPNKKDPAAASSEGGCSWVLQCEGPGNNKCVSVRQCAGD